jgi:hypothetical protein
VQQDGIIVGGLSYLQFAAATTIDSAAYATPDTSLRRRAAANPAWGVASAAPTAYTHSLAADARAGTDTNTAGAAATITPGNGTGNATPSTLILQTPTAVASGTGAQTMETRVVVDGTGLVIPKTAGYGLKVDTAAPTYPWRDLIGRISPREVGGTAPTLAVYRGGAVREYAFAANDLADLQFHWPHDWVPGTDVFIHVHWSHHGTAISGSIVFDFFSTFAKGFGGSIFPAEIQTTLTVSTPNIATIPQYSHRVDEIQLSAASPTGNQLDTDDFEVDGLLLTNFRVTTIPTITGGATNEPFVHHIDLHYQSTGMGTKNKAPSPTFYS